MFLFLSNVEVKFVGFLGAFVKNKLFHIIGYYK